MLFVVLIQCLFLCSTFAVKINLIEREFDSPIEKLLLIKNHLFVGTTNSLHRLSLLTLNRTRSTLNFASSPCSTTPRDCSTSSSNEDYHFKLLLSTNDELILSCGTNAQGSCQLIDLDLNIVYNSSVPVVANDPVNSTVGLVIPATDLIYLGVTYTNEGKYRWQIPNIAGRSLQVSRFMKILSANDEQNDENLIYRDDLSLRFMPRQQASFIVQYVYAFSTSNYVYFLSNQPSDIETNTIVTKIIRFCRKTSAGLIRSYTELPLVCSSSDWIVQDAQLVSNKHNEKLLIGLFVRRDGSTGTNICSWRIRRDIDRAFQENYKQCHSLGIGQRGLNFIKPNEPCRRDETWSIGMKENEENLCPWIISDRLPYPVGANNPLFGQLIYTNSFESSTALELYSFGDNSSIFLFQGLTNGTFKLGKYEFSSSIEWFYSHQLSSRTNIHRDVLFDEQSGSLYIASRSKISRLSFADDCASRVSCDECLSSSINPFCGWCTINERCTLSSDCSSKNWQQDTHRCTQISDVQPMNASLDRSQWINLTLSNLSPLAHDEIYKCTFNDEIISVDTQAIKLDQNHLSCPTPTDPLLDKQIANPIKVNLSLIKWPSNKRLATINEFVLFNCSFYSSCQACQKEKACQWCSNRCSSICAEASLNCPSFKLIDSTRTFYRNDKTVDIALQLIDVQPNSSIDCRLNGTIVGRVDENSICRFASNIDLTRKGKSSFSFAVFQENISIGIEETIEISSCQTVNSCELCQRSSSCSWCDGKCRSKRLSSCPIDDQCSSIRIEDFYPKEIPLGGETEVTIVLNELVTEQIENIYLADLPCSSIRITDQIRCFSRQSNSTRRGFIRISFRNSMRIYSNQSIEYLQPNIEHFHPKLFYEFGGQILHLTGKHLRIGNQQEIFIGPHKCLIFDSNDEQRLSCRIPSIPPGIYNLTIEFDKKTIVYLDRSVSITPNPIVRDIHPTTSFASGGRLVTIRGMYFNSIQSILVEFSYDKWNSRFQILPKDITSSEDGLVSSFQFRTPSILSSLKEFGASLPIYVHLSLHFDNLIFLPNLIQFNYVRDILLNVSSTLPSLSYTGEELKLHVENLTEAASIEDIEIFVGCSMCSLKSFTSKGITCQPPVLLETKNVPILNNEKQPVDCSLENKSVGPIRFRIGFREYLIGYLSYDRQNSGRYPLSTIIYLSLSSCCLTLVLLGGALFFYLKMKKSKEKGSSISSRRDLQANDKLFWSTTTSGTVATTAPYYQVYEQIPSSSSNQNTLTRTPLLVCPYHCQPYSRQEYSTLSMKTSSIIHSTLLTTISADHNHLKQVFFVTDHLPMSSIIRQSMELFYDLLELKPFCDVFIEQILSSDREDLMKCLIYLFRYETWPLNKFPSRNDLGFFKFVSTLFIQSEKDLKENLSPFDRLIHSIIDFIDSSPHDSILDRSLNALSPSKLLSVLHLNYERLKLPIIYENSLQVDFQVFDCDSIDQIKEKFAHYLNTTQTHIHLINDRQLDVICPTVNRCSCSRQKPTIKDYPINSLFIHRVNSTWKESPTSSSFDFHLVEENLLVDEPNFVQERIRQNKKSFQPVLNRFYQEILQGLNLFSTWRETVHQSNNSKRFYPEYIQLVSEFVRRLSKLIVTRSSTSIVQSFLHFIADGLEIIFDVDKEFPNEIRSLFEDEKRFIASLDKSPSQFVSSNVGHSHLPFNIRSIVLSDDRAIESLLKLYQFYELKSEIINQQIGENHVSILLPVHHLLVQIRQLIHSNATDI